MPCSAIGAEDDLLAIRRPHRRGIRHAREGDAAFLAAATQIDDVDVGECILPVNLRDRDFPAVWRKAEIHVLAERADGAVNPALTRLPHQIGAHRHRSVCNRAVAGCGERAIEVARGGHVFGHRHLGPRHPSRLGVELARYQRPIRHEENPVGRQEGGSTVGVEDHSRRSPVQRGQIDAFVRLLPRIPGEEQEAAAAREKVRPTVAAHAGDGVRGRDCRGRTAARRTRA